MSFADGFMLKLGAIFADVVVGVLSVIGLFVVALLLSAWFEIKGRRR